MNKRITVNPNIHFGKPCITGTRIPVKNILELVREGVSFENIISDYYPDIEAEDIRACIQFRLKYSTTLPYAFTEHGAIMAANVLKSDKRKIGFKPDKT